MLSLKSAFTFSARNWSTILACRSKHTLPDLPYDFGALEPVICREIMELHHQKHHNTYVTNLNAAEEQLKDAVAKKDVSKVINLGQAIKFNGGGHINHSIFWKNLTPDTTEPSAELSKAIIKDFQSIEKCKAEMKAAAIAVQGSGWAWLGYNKKSKSLQVVPCPNQDPLEGTTGLIPLFGIDVWEHAYYLQYKNLRPSYVDAVFEIMNWKDISERFSKAQ